MTNITKWAVIMPCAALATAAVFLGMRGLIAGEWQPQDKARAQKFEINPVVVDIPVVTRATKQAKLEAVEIPPAPPIIDRQEASLPSEPIAPAPKYIPPFDIPELDLTSAVLAVEDTNAVPIIRIPPIAPPRFLEGNYSGHCKVVFDVSAEGSPFNVTATGCTASYLERPTVKSVQKWRFNPKIQNGRPVAMQGVRNKVVFKLLDERGNPLPEPGY